MRDKIEIIINKLLSHQLSKDEAVNELDTLIKPINKKSVKGEESDCTCDKEEIFYDEELDVIFCSCGKLLIEENEGTFKKHGIYFDTKNKQWTSGEKKSTDTVVK